MKVSDCCGASPAVIGDYDCDTSDFGICPECKEHCEYIEEDEFYKEDSSEEEKNNSNEHTQ